MGFEIFIQNKRVCIKPLRSRLEAIQKLQPPSTTKGCRSFAGMVNFLSMFCPELQKLLMAIYDLTRKGRPLLWGKEQEDSFEETHIGWLNLQFCICQIPLVDFIVNLTPVNFLLEVHDTKY